MVGQLVVRDVVADEDPVLDAELGREAAQALDLLELAGRRIGRPDRQEQSRPRDAGGDGGQRSDQEVVALVVGDAAEGEDEGPLEVEVALQRGPRASLEPVMASTQEGSDWILSGS